MKVKELINLLQMLENNEEVVVEVKIKKVAKDAPKTQETKPQTSKRRGNNMSQLDKQKEKVSNYRLAWGIVLTALFGMIAFIFNAFDKLPFFKQLLVTFGFIAIIVVVLYLTWKLKIETDKLENL